jgi:hypothetical protein
MLERYVDVMCWNEILLTDLNSKQRFVTEIMVGRQRNKTRSTGSIAIALYISPPYTVCLTVCALQVYSISLYFVLRRHCCSLSKGSVQ